MGIDPGLTGGLALLTTDGMQVERMPILQLNGKKTLDIAALEQQLNEWQPSHVYLERQQSMPRQGVTSSFNTGYHYGLLKGLVTGMKIPLTEVRPAEWKRNMRVPKDKDAARARASELMPANRSDWALKRDDGLAEAALIALYGLGVL
jgi:crossover junction endodeoxyribonuclease RuvC